MLVSILPSLEVSEVLLLGIAHVCAVEMKVVISTWVGLVRVAPPLVLLLFARVFVVLPSHAARICSAALLCEPMV